MESNNRRCWCASRQSGVLWCECCKKKKKKKSLSNSKTTCSTNARIQYLLSNSECVQFILTESVFISISTFSTAQSCQRQSDRCQVSRRSCQLVELINSSMHVAVSNGASSPRCFACVWRAPGVHAQLASALQCLVLRLIVCLQSLLLMWARNFERVAPVAHDLGDECLRQVDFQLASPAGRQ
jgi:hypothetical protein